MNQRLVWNFEFAPSAIPLPHGVFIEQETESLKWEIRLFWPDDQIIVLNTIDSTLLDLANYQQKHREDYYYLLSDNDSNIKRRHDELYYKPLVKRASEALGFGAKVKIDSLPGDQKKGGTEIYVKKEAMIYKFPTNPTIKLELARLEVLNKIYFSICIEGKSLILVEKIAELLLDKPISCDYITFLKNILQS